MLAGYTRDGALIDAATKAVMPAVEAAGVSHAFGHGSERKVVLHEVSLKLKPGEFAVLTGPSGAGKTTLLTLIGALRSIQEGSIRITGEEIAGLDRDGQQRIRRKIGFIFQGHNLFDALTAFETLKLTTELADDPPSAEEALVRASHLLVPLGLGDYLHARPTAMSTGQKQRVAIARALINEPPLILADEPTASLDKQAADTVISLLKERVAAAGATILMITHDTRIFDYADRVVEMIDGRIRAPA